GDELDEVPVIQRQLAHLEVGDQAASRGSLQFDLGGAGFDVHFFGDGAGLEGDVDGQAIIDVELDGRASVLLEARRLDGDFVTAGKQVRSRVRSVVVGGERAHHDILDGLFNGHGSAGDVGAVGVLNNTDNTAGNLLCARRNRHRGQAQQQE